MSKSDRIRRLLARGLSVKEIAKRLKATTNLVHQVKWQAERKKKAQPERSHDPKVKKAEKKYLKAVKTNKPSKIIKAVKEMKQALDVIDMKPTKLIIQPQYKAAALKLLDMKEVDLVNKPPHYTDGGVDTLKFIEAKDLNYRLGNVVKYISRAGKKVDSDPIQDLEKARFYLEREIEARRDA
jgi:transposase